MKITKTELMDLSSNERTELSPFFSGSWGELWVRECELLMLEEIYRTTQLPQELTVEERYAVCCSRALATWRRLIDAGVFKGVEPLEERFAFFSEVFKDEGEYLLLEAVTKLANV